MQEKTAPSLEQVLTDYEYLVILYYFRNGTSIRAICKKFKRHVRDVEEILRVTSDRVQRYKPLGGRI